MTNFRKPSRRLTFTDAVQIWKRASKGEYQNRIAADYDCNSARVNDVLKGRKFPGSREAALGSPPPEQGVLF